ncbi:MULTISPECIES: membrane integrity-associated transporter subunit PqiC [unclassified Pseudomonas]|uniref:PqiC family protein n=1 Tax=unclassified Pseudomonas TaxID=196821 RepID=UPI000A1FC968|nr:MULTISPECIES: PqiC family protein [unclassified Pseudomonas]
MALPLKFTVLAACLLLGACRSDPISFHTLTPAQPMPGRSGQDIAIESISVPPQVDRPQIVIRQGNSGLAILETQWWGASLSDELRSALVDQLSNAGVARKTSVRIDVQRFDSIPGQYGLMDVKWRLRPADAGDSGLLTCRSILQTPSGPSIDDLVNAQQNNVKRLAELIRQAAGNARSCPPS